MLAKSPDYLIFFSVFRSISRLPVARYAAAEIPEVWIEHLENNELLVYRNPSGEAYVTAFVLRTGDSISPLAFPETTFSGAALLG